MSEFRAGFFQHLHKLFGDIDAKPTSNHLTSRIDKYLRQYVATAKKPFSTTDIFPSVAVRADSYMRQLRKCSHVVTPAFLDHNSPGNRSQTTAACKKWMKSSITIAVSSVCNNEILTDRLNKIQLRTVWCSINFYFCSKQTMNVFFHYMFAWICVDFSCKTAFISYHVMSAKTRVLKCCRLLFDWTEFWESSTLLNRESWLAYDDFREKTWLDHGTRTICFT